MVRRLLIRLALDLQFPPFVWAFQAYYALAVLAAVRSVRRVTGVRAIYLCGSLARRDVIYGLSDLDFKIFAEGTAAGGARQAIQERFARLRRWFPVLGPPDEKGIYLLDDFAADYRHYPLVQHLFDERFYRHELLWGEDVLPRLPVLPWPALDQGLTFFWKLKDWTEKVSLLAGTARISRIQKHYLFYKACCDVGLMWLCSASSGRALGAREAVMEELAGRLEGADAAWVKSLAAERRAGWRRFETDPDRNYLAFKRLLDTCLPDIAGRDAASTACSFVVSRSPLPAQDSAPHVAALRAIVPRATVSVTPWAFVPRSALDSAFTGRPVYVVVPREPLALAQADALRAYSRSQMAAAAALVVKERPGWHYAVDAVLVDHWLGTPVSDDLLGLHIAGTKTVALSARQATRIAERLAGFRAQLAPSLGSPDLGRMDGPDFDGFFFTALRVLIVGREFAAGRLWLHGAPEDSLDYLKARAPSLGRFLDLLRDAHDQVRAGRLFNERLRAKAIGLLTACLTAADGGAWGALEPLADLPDQSRAAISLVIVTRGRPRQLARCLPTLLAQRRHPDELIVIDSSSDDATKHVVTALAAPYPIRYIRRPPEGVAAARNAGVHAAAHEIIAFGDDDVVMEPDWLENLEFCFLRDRRIGIAGGSIHHMECGREDAVARFMRIAEKL